MLHQTMYPVSGANGMVLPSLRSVCQSRHSCAPSMYVAEGRQANKAVGSAPKEPDYMVVEVAAAVAQAGKISLLLTHGHPWSAVVGFLPFPSWAFSELPTPLGQVGTLAGIFGFWSY